MAQGGVDDRVGIGGAALDASNGTAAHADAAPGAAGVWLDQRPRPAPVWAGFRAVDAHRGGRPDRAQIGHQAGRDAPAIPNYSRMCKLGGNRLGAKSLNVREPDLTREPTVSAYRPDIDGLRAIAVTAVVLFHAGAFPFRSGYVGVDIFFVISGYLIGGIILREAMAGRFSFAVFYARRARRILPALFTVVLATCAAGWFLLSPAQFRD